MGFAANFRGRGWSVHDTRKNTPKNTPKSTETSRFRGGCRGSRKPNLALGFRLILFFDSSRISRISVLQNAPAARKDFTRSARSGCAFSLSLFAPLLNLRGFRLERGAAPIDSEGAEGAEGGSPALCALRNEKPTLRGVGLFSKSGRQVIDDD